MPTSLLGLWLSAYYELMSMILNVWTVRVVITLVQTSKHCYRKPLWLLAASLDMRQKHCLPSTNSCDQKYRKGRTTKCMQHQYVHRVERRKSKLAQPQHLNMKIISLVIISYKCTYHTGIKTWYSFIWSNNVKGIINNFLSDTLTTCDNIIYESEIFTEILQHNQDVV